MSTDDLRYTGKPGELSRTIGDGSLPSSRNLKGKSTSTLKNHLISTLDEIQAITSENIANMAAALRDVAVAIPEHSALNKAKEQEWPADLSTAKNTIGYDFYTAMKIKNTSGSTYLQSYYRDNVLKSKYASFMDIGDICQIIFDESKRIENFVNKYMGDTVGSEKTATFRLLQEWADYALEVTRGLRGIESQKDKEMLSSIATTNMDKVSPEESKQLQAFFQGKVNAINTVISSDLEAVKKSHGYLADRFYEDHLGPALVIRGEVVGNLEKIQPTVGQSVAQDVNKSTSIYNSNLKVALSDQMIRNRVFKDRVENTLVNIGVRDGYIGTIDKLSTFGSPTTPQVVKEEPSKEEVDYFQAYTGTDEDIFKASHKYLDDVNDPNAHPQYLLKEGDELTGDISVKEGVLIDGVQISKHKHNGEDGSERIDATDLVEGSLEIASINKDETVVKPEALKFVASKTMLNASTALMDATFQWEGERDNSFEIQIAPVEEFIPDTLDNVFRIKQLGAGDPTPVVRGTYSPGLAAATMKTANGDTWFSFLSEDADADGRGDFNLAGRNVVNNPAMLKLMIASGSTDSALFYDAITDTEFTTDEKLLSQQYSSLLWVLRAGEVSASYYDEDIIMCAGNKVWLVMGESESATPDFSVASVLKEFSVDEQNSADIYSMSLDASDNSIYFFVKLSEYDDTRLKSANTTIELWKISADNEFDKLFSWENEEELDSENAETGTYGWYSYKNIGEKDYTFLGVGTVENGFIYGWKPKWFEVPTQTLSAVVATLAKIDLSTLKSEFIAAENYNSIIYSIDEIDYNLTPVVKDGVIYLPSYVASLSEIFDYVNTRNTIVTIKDGIFRRHAFRMNDPIYYNQGRFARVTSDRDGNIYGIYHDISNGYPDDPLGAIYNMGSIDV